MGSIKSFGEVVQEILLNNNLEAILKTWKLDFVPTFWNFIRENISKKLPVFQNLNTNISRTTYDKKINEPILKSFH